MKDWVLIKEWFVRGASEFIGMIDLDEEEISEKMQKYGGDETFIEGVLREQYPGDTFFVLADYDEDSDEFHIRVWELKDENR